MALLETWNFLQPFIYNTLNKVQHCAVSVQHLIFLYYMPTDVTLSKLLSNTDHTPLNYTFTCSASWDGETK